MAGPRRPDPRQGVFETLLVHDGHVVELDAHLARLQASLAEVFPTHPLPTIDVPSFMHLYGRQIGSTSIVGALRLTVAPTGGEILEARIERREAPAAAEAALASLVLPGGLGAHKWADRSLIDEAQARLPSGGPPLIVDADGAALEASRANVFAVRDGALFTPPLDGRILPGITRRRVLEIAASLGVETHERRLSPHDLLAADEVFLTGSVRGVEPVGSIDGASLRAAPAADSGSLAAVLAASLRRAWLGAPVS